MTEASKKFVLISPTAYKGTLSPHHAARLIQKAIRQLKPQWKTRLLPLADGGDGSLEVLNETLNGKYYQTRVKGPLGTPTRAKWSLIRRNVGSLKGPVAVIEMAQASGLALVKGKNQILKAHTYGTGQLIRAALQKNAKTILIGVGGAATGDGGAGALAALGIRYHDRNGRNLNFSPKSLKNIHHVAYSRLDTRLKKTSIYVMCDVTNPLLGPRGSARTFGPQKGANRSQVIFLERFLRNWSRVAPKKIHGKPGTGAAGGLAFGLAAFANAQLTKGAPFIMKVTHWKEAATRSHLIITGEGRLDSTSFSGKVTGTVISEAGAIPVWGVCGSSGLAMKTVKRKGMARLALMGPQGLRQPQKTMLKTVVRLIQS